MNKKNSPEVALSPCVRLFVEWLLEEGRALSAVEPMTPPQLEVIAAPAKPTVVLEEQLALCG